MPIWWPVWSSHVPNYSVLLLLFYTFNSLSLFWLAKSVQRIFQSRTLMVTSNHVMYDRGAWFLRVIISSLSTLCCLPSVKKQNMTSRFALLTEQDIEEIVEDKDSQTQKGWQRWQRSCLLITWKRKKWENLRYFHTFSFTYCNDHFFLWVLCTLSVII